MSFDFNYKFWVATKKDLKDLIKRQNVLKNREPIEDPLVTFKMMSQLYVLYSEMVSKLSYLYKITFQVQKKELIRELAEAFLRQLLALKNELKSIELSEYVYLDKTLISRKMTPQNLIIWRSPNFLRHRPPEIENIIFDKRLFNAEVVEKEKADKQNSIKKAVIRIQAHERARQARIYKSAINYNKNNLKKIVGKNMSYVFTHKKDQTLSIPVKRTIFNTNFLKPNESCSYLMQIGRQYEEVVNKETEDSLKDRDQSALIIQKAWKRHKSNKLCKMQRCFKQSLYGMRKKRKLENPDEYRDFIMEMYKNDIVKKKLEDDYIKLMTDERTRILQELKPQIMEDISDHIRAWFREFYDKTADFHPYPEAIKSGTVLVLIDESMDFVEFKEYKAKQGLSKQEKKNMEEKLKLQKQKQKEKMKKEKLKEAKRLKKLKDAGICDISHDLRTSKTIERIEKTMSTFSTDWRHVDEYLNKQNEAIGEWVTEGELATIHRELRMLVDEYMRIEYELLKKAWSVDNKQPYKPTKSKSPKKPKEKRRKKYHDLTEDRTIESLFEELKTAGVIENISKKYFDDFIGEFNWLADDTRNESQRTTSSPAKADIKMVIQDNIFGMGEFNAEKPKSLCLIGPTSCGKKLLCNIIATELDALFMNLSPERTHQFTGNLKYFVHVVMKVAKAFEPTIIFIQDAHRVFWKKVPKEQTHLNPTLLKDVLLKNILKPLKKDDKIMVVGTSDMPWSANPKFKSAFQTILLVPKSDYGTIFLLWLELLTQNINQNDLNYNILSALAKVFRAYNTGDITTCMAKTMNVARRLRTCSHPLDPNEFLEYFINRSDPVFPPDEKVFEKYETFYNKTNKFGKMKAIALLKEAQKQKKK